MIKDRDGVEKIPIHNDMEVLHKLSTSNMVDFANRMAYNKDKVAVFNFGKHKNKPVTEVLETDKGYYDWIMRSDFPLNTKQKLTEIKLSMFNSK